MPHPATRIALICKGDPDIPSVARSLAAWALREAETDVDEALYVISYACGVYGPDVGARLRCLIVREIERMP